MNGQGTFLGSVCTPADNVRLRFSTVATNGTIIYSEWTPQFNVSGMLLHMVYFTQYLLFECVYRNITCGWNLPNLLRIRPTYII